MPSDAQREVVRRERARGSARAAARGRRSARRRSRPSSERIGGCSAARADQAAGRRHQPDAEAGRSSAPRRDRSASRARAARRRGRAGGAGSRHAAAPGSRRRRRRRASATTRSARRDELRAVRDHQHRAAARAGARPPRATSAALAGSRSAVGSSRMTSGASRRNARASAIRRRSPAESARPPSPIDRLVAVGQRRDEPVRARAHRGRLADRLVRRAGRAEADVVGDRAAEERRPLRHPRELRAATRAASQRARSTPPTVMRPPVGSARPSSSAATVLLPAPLGADERDGLARARARGRAVEDGRRRAPGRRSPTPSKPDGAAARARRRAAAPAPHRRRRVEQREHPLGDRQAVGARVELGAEPAQRQVQLRGEHEHRQRRPRAPCRRRRAGRRPSPRRARRRASRRARARRPRGTRPAASPIVARRCASPTSRDRRLLRLRRGRTRAASAARARRRGSASTSRRSADQCSRVRCSV